MEGAFPKGANLTLGRSGQAYRVGTIYIKTRTFDIKGRTRGVIFGGGLQCSAWI